MHVFRGIPHHITQSIVLAIGNFDGVHQGHQALLQRLVSCARQAKLPAVVLTFEPHPREYFTPEQAPARLTNLREKLSLLREQGVDQVCVCRFDHPWSALTAQAFIQKILVEGLAIHHLIVGDDFRFGRGRVGDFSMLQAASSTCSFSLEAMPTMSVGSERVSSSLIRDALSEGDLEHAARLLGRGYSIAGRVVYGAQLGRQLGYATANIQLKRQRVALSGVFAVYVVGLENGPHAGVANVGVRPTLSQGERPSLEVHLFDFDRDIYHQHVTVCFQKKLREEMKFSSLDALKNQIAQDAIAARNFF